jgi:hypothetical protein
VRNASNDAYLSPRSGLGSNCSFAGAPLPPGGANGAVGITGNAWASDLPPATNKSDGTLYSYLRFVLSPSTLLSSIRTGFTNNF